MAELTKQDLTDALTAVRIATKKDLTEGLAEIRVATKQDLTEGLAAVRAATKQDITEAFSLFATKQDLTDGLTEVRVATKRDLTEGLAAVRTATKHDLTDALTHVATKQDLHDVKGALATNKQDLTTLFRTELANTKQDIIVAVGDQLIKIVDTMATNKELRHQGVVIEQMQDKLDVVLEATSSVMIASETVKRHEARLRKLEAESVVIKDTVKLHSKLLRPTK